MADDKIITIETTLSHHERQIQELSEMIGAQWKEIERLKRRLDEVLSKIDEDGGAPPASAKPPHY